MSQAGSDREVRTVAAPEDAFAVAMRDHGQRLARLAYFLCPGDRSGAEDLVAETYARVWPRWKSAQVDDLLPYLRRAMVNLASKHRRHRLVVQRHGAASEPSSAPGADEGLGARIDLARALGTLPSSQRVVVVLRYLEDMSEAEIASLLHIAPGTVKSRLSRALETLRADLRGGGDG